MTFPVSNKLSAQQTKKCYTKTISYKKFGEKFILGFRVQCEDPKVGMFCSHSKKWGRPSPSAKGGWTTRRIIDWKHASKLLKLHSESKWHQDSSVTEKWLSMQSSRMALKCNVQVLLNKLKSKRNRIVR